MLNTSMTFVHQCKTVKDLSGRDHNDNDSNDERAAQYGKAAQASGPPSCLSNHAEGKSRKVAAKQNGRVQQRSPPGLKERDVGRVRLAGALLLRAGGRRRRERVEGVVVRACSHDCSQRLPCSARQNKR